MAPDAARLSLLMYEWRTDRFEFTAIESANLVLLRVKDSKKRLFVDSNVPGKVYASNDRIAQVMKRLLSKRVVGDPLVITNFRLGLTVEAGKAYTNARMLNAPLPGDWAKSVIVFLTNKDLCILVGKAWPNLPRSQETPEDRWLATGLYDADGTTLVIERLWGKPFPRTPHTPRLSK